MEYAREGNKVEFGLEKAEIKFMVQLFVISNTYGANGDKLYYLVMLSWCNVNKPGGTAGYPAHPRLMCLSVLPSVIPLLSFLRIIGEIFLKN